MGLFDGIKGFFNMDGVKAEITHVENPDFTDTAVKVDYKLMSGIEATVKSINASFFALLGDDEIEVAATELNNSIKVEAGKENKQTLHITGVNLAEALKEQGISSKEIAKQKNIKFKVLLEIDVQEAVGMFDPTTERIVHLKA